MESPISGQPQAGAARETDPKRILARPTAGSEAILKTNGTEWIHHDLSFTYDMLGELTAASMVDRETPHVLDWSATYDYHKDGNLDDRSVTHNSVTEDDNFNYTADSDLISNIDGSTVTWDNNGNMVAGLTSSLTWNWDNRLREGSVGANTLDCVYAPSGEMIYKETYVDGSPGVTTKRKFIVDTTGGYPMILMELDPDNSNAIEKTYINANGQTLMQRDGDQSTGNRYFYLHDRLGNVRALIDAGGDMVNCYVYDPFGNALDVSGETQETIENRFRFAGYKWDPITEMYNCNARWYDPDLARFTDRDPVLGDFQEPLTLHAYLYCLNDPINGIDPTGRFLEITLPGAINFAQRTANAAGSYIAQNWAKETLIGAASAWNGVTQGYMNSLFGPDDMSDSAKFMIGFIAGFGEMQIGLRTNAKLGTLFSSTFTATTNAAASESQDLFTLRNAIGIGISVSVGALGDWANKADVLDPITMWAIGVDAGMGAGLWGMGHDYLWEPENE